MKNTATASRRCPAIQSSARRIRSGEAFKETKTVAVTRTSPRTTFSSDEFDADRPACRADLGVARGVILKSTIPTQPIGGFSCPSSPCSLRRRRPWRSPQTKLRPEWSSAHTARASVGSFRCLKAGLEQLCFSLVSSPRHSIHAGRRCEHEFDAAHQLRRYQGGAELRGYPPNMSVPSAHRLVEQLAVRTDWLAGWLAGWLIDWLTDRLADRLTD